MLCATDGHAKNFSLFLQAGGQYRSTPLYDVLSAYPLLGEGPGRLSPFKVKMAMAVRAKNAHWRMRDILRRHWLAVGKRQGVIAEDGGQVDRLIDGIVERTPAVIANVSAKLGEGFPATLAEAVFEGMREAASRLAA